MGNLMQTCLPPAVLYDRFVQGTAVEMGFDGGFGGVGVGNGSGFVGNGFVGNLVVGGDLTS